MKFIFDFDDVLFHTTSKFKKHKDAILAKAGLPLNLSREYSEKERWNLFSLKKMLAHFSISPKLYEKIMEESKNYVNKELLEIIKKIGKSNCYLVTYGDEEFQKDKIKRTDVSPFFSEIIIVSDSKKEAIEKICAKYKNEKVVFIDDKAKHFENLDFKKCPNLKTILYDEKGLEKLRSILPSL
jgi:HAD superfamily hydrolase (TIGR01509 family)